MTDAEGVEFLRWCLPRLDLAWHGFRFRRIRRGVYRRIEERMRQLGAPDLGVYRAYLEGEAAEWAVLDSLCWIPISRFYRDKAVFQFLERTVLPAVSSGAMARHEGELRCWSVGCAAGEEPYTLALLWRLRVAAAFPTLRLRVVATDIDPAMIRRASGGCYPAHSVRDLPADITAKAFRRSSAGYCVRGEFRGDVEFVEQDIRRTMPGNGFHLILCRNLVLTYFEDALQRRILARMMERVLPAGAVIFGLTETVPAGVSELEPWSAPLRVYRRTNGVAPSAEAPGRSRRRQDGGEKGSTSSDDAVGPARASPKPQADSSGARRPLPGKIETDSEVRVKRQSTRRRGSATRHWRPGVGRRGATHVAQRRLRGIGATLESLRVKDVMTCNPVTTKPDVPVTQAAALMLEGHIGSLPVVEDGKLVGIVTDRNAVKALAARVPALQRLPALLW